MSLSRSAPLAFAISLAIAFAILGAAPAAAAAAEGDAAPAADAAPADAAIDAGGAGGDIVVTASRREQRLQDVPTAITALSGSFFTNGGVGRSANEVLAYVPNASASERRTTR